MALRDILVHFGISVDQTQLVEAQKNVNNLVIRFNQLQRIAGFALAALGLGVFTDSLDKVAAMDNRLKSVTNSLDELKVAQEGVTNVARETLSPVEDVAALYQRYTQVTDGLGKSQQDVLAFTESLIKAGKLSGASTAELQGALVQLGQGLGNNFKSGGQELNSILEQTPMIAKIIADHIGVKKGDLKEAAKSGKITAETVFEAFQKRAAELDQKFGARNKTFEEVRVALGIEWGELMKQLLPVMKEVVEWLLRGVKAIRAWVDNGEAMNSLISGMIVVVGALAIAFGGLALSVLATIAPFLALFVILEDFVTFMRGGESILGDFFGGPEEQKKARETIQGVWDKLKEFVDWVSDPERMGQTFRGLYDSAIAWGTKTVEWLKAQIDELVRYANDKVKTFIFGERGGFLRDAADGGQDKTADNEAFLRGAGDDARRALGVDIDAKAVEMIGGGLQNAVTSFVGFHNAAASAGDSVNAWLENAKAQVQAFVGVTPEATPSAAVRGANAQQGGPVNITNEVIVQGNATSATAREVAQRTGAATAGALGRDRAAIGAAVGIAP